MEEDFTAENAESAEKFKVNAFAFLCALRVLCGEISYSYRSASMGSRRDAFHAG